MHRLLEFSMAGCGLKRANVWEADAAANRKRPPFFSDQARRARQRGSDGERPETPDDWWGHIADWMSWIEHHQTHRFRFEND